MYCPRCGTPNEPGDKFCAACGEALGRSATAKGEDASGSGLSRILGSDRKTKLISAATIAALVVAVIAFIAISPDDNSIPRDRYTLAAEKICLQSKRHIVVAANAGGSYARQLVPIVVRWREELGDLKVPSDRVEQERALDEALREVEIEVAQLARLGERGDRVGVIAAAKRADTATATVEEAVANLGLSECAKATIGFAGSK